MRSDNSFMMKIPRLRFVWGVACRGLWWNLIIQMDILGRNGAELTQSNHWWRIVCSFSPISVAPLDVLHPVNVNVIGIFSATSSWVIFLKSRRLLSRDSRPACSDSACKRTTSDVTINQISSLNKNENKNLNSTNPYSEHGDILSLPPSLVQHSTQSWGHSHSNCREYF